MNFQRRSPPLPDHPAPPDPVRRLGLDRWAPVRREPPTTVSLGDADLDAALPEGGLELGVIHEIMPAAEGDTAAALGFALGLLARITLSRPGPVLWATTHDPGRHGGAYAPGLSAAGFDPGRLIHLRGRSARDALWALEESLASAGFAAAIGILARDSRHYDFTASRRLSLRAAESGGTALVLRIGDETGGATAAATRWSIAARPSVPIRHPGHAMPSLGPPRWRIDLVRCKRGRPHDWLVEWDHETVRFHLAAPLADRAPVARPAPARQDLPRHPHRRTA